MLSPHKIDEVLIDGFVLATLFLDLLSKLPRIGCRDHARVYPYDFAAVDLVYGPLLYGGYILYALLQQLPIAV